MPKNLTLFLPIKKTLFLLKHAKLHQLMYFDFARSLPEKRCIDYQLSLTGKIMTEQASDNARPRKTEENARTRKIEAKTFLTPFELHRAANPKLKFIEARTSFSALNNKKLIKLVKEAEKIYDSVIMSFELNFIEKNKKNFFLYFEKNDTDGRPELTKILTKTEMKLLFESYGMPETIPAR